jgi:hypothetical protein
MNKSRILSLINAALDNTSRIVARIKVQAHLSQPSASAPSKGIPTDFTSWTYNPTRSELRESWAIGDAFFKMMKQDCDEHSAEFWIVTIGMAGEVNPNMSDRKALQERIGLNSLLLSDQCIEELARNHDIHVITLAPRMGDFALNHHVALHGFFNTAFNEGHWNETGHEVAGSIITQDLLRRSALLPNSHLGTGQR